MSDRALRLKSLFFLFSAIVFVGAGCQSSITPIGSSTSNIEDTLSRTIATRAFTETTPNIVQTSTPSPVHYPSDTPPPTLTQTQYPSPTISQSKIPTSSSTPSITPTYSILRGTVLEQSNCRYGPGAAYLYKYGLYPGNNLEIIGRNDTGTWILVRAIGGHNPCWLKASLMDIHGEVMSLGPASIPLPQSPYYGPLTGVLSKRDGNTVIISWNPLVLRAGDDSLQYPYLIEAWLCHAGQLIFYPIGSWETIVSVQDEPGCSAPSHARVYGVEKHGYTSWVSVPWTSP